MKNDTKVVIGIIIGFLAFSIFSWFPNPEIKDFVRFAINVAFCFFLYRGQNWARWVMGILSGLAGIMAIVFLIKPGFSNDAQSVYGLASMVVMGSFYCVASYVLISKKFVADHFERNLNSFK